MLIGLVQSGGCGLGFCRRLCVLGGARWVLMCLRVGRGEELGMYGAEGRRCWVLFGRLGGLMLLRRSWWVEHL